MAARLLLLEDLQQVRKERHFREREVHLEDFNDEELYKRYRFSRGGIEFLADLLRADLQPVTARSHAIPLHLKILVALRFLATGSMQLTLSDTVKVSQPSVSRIVKSFVDALCRHSARFIYMPVAAELQDIKLGFYRHRNFPNVIGTIDGTQVRIQAPAGEAEAAYVNRKGYHSINAQVVMDDKQYIRHVCAKFPGSVHDARVLRQSGLWDLFNGGYAPNCVLLGDSGYPNTNWLLTPYPGATTDAQKRYNR